MGVKKKFDRFVEWYYSSPLHWGATVFACYILGMILGKVLQ